MGATKGFSTKQLWPEECWKVLATVIGIGEGDSVEIEKSSKDIKLWKMCKKRVSHTCRITGRSCCFLAGVESCQSNRVWDETTLRTAERGCPSLLALPPDFSWQQPPSVSGEQVGGMGRSVERGNARWVLLAWNQNTAKETPWGNEAGMGESGRLLSGRVCPTFAFLDLRCPVYKMITIILSHLIIYNISSILLI